MNSHLNIGEKPISKKIRISNLKPSRKIYSPINPNTNLKNLFPKDFFENPNEQSELLLKKINSENINENKSDEIFSKINPLNKENIIFKISCKIDNSSNFKNTKNIENNNFISKDLKNKDDNFEEDIFKETPHFFPKVNKKEENKISNYINLNNFDNVKVNKEIKNLFNNIPEKLKSDPDINEKVEMLLKNIYEMKQIIHDKKKRFFSPSSQRNLRKIENNSRYIKI